MEPPVQPVFNRCHAIPDSAKYKEISPESTNNNMVKETPVKIIAGYPAFFVFTPLRCAA